MTDDMKSREGELLAGKYRLQTRLGVGGMGEVYRARDEFVGRDVAIKVLRPELCRHPEIVQRFLREVRAANAIQHENLVDVIDLGTDDQNIPFVVQELLVGHNLAHHRESSGNSLPPAEILALMIPVVDAIATAHQRGVVHRDLKPENIFLSSSTQGVVPRVLDFGISKIVQPGAEKLTAKGTAMGKPTYMSPEQLQGASDLDARADVWALGVMLYELASGVLPFMGPSAGAIFVGICTRDPAPLSQHVPEVTSDYARIVERCLRRDLAARYPSAAPLLRDLRHLQLGEAIESTGVVAFAAIAVAAAEIERLTLDDRAEVGGTLAVDAQPEHFSTKETVASVSNDLQEGRREETLVPVVRSPPPARRTALTVGATAAVLAAIAILAFVSSGHRGPLPEAALHAVLRSTPSVTAVRAVIPSPPASVALPVVTPVADAAVPVASPVVVGLSPTSPFVAPASAIEERPALNSVRHHRHHRHGRHRSDLPAATATVALPVIAAPRSSGVGTAQYD